MLAWLDLETTGLEPKEDDILEIALMITEDEAIVPGIFAYTSTILPIRKSFQEMEELVQNMHTTSSLWNDVMWFGQTVENVQDEIVYVLQKYDLKNVPLCGSSVHFDRAFLKEHMPRVERLFSYRNVDVSTLKELAIRWGYPVPEKADAHRAGPDILESIEHLNFYRKNMIWPGPELKKSFPGWATVS